MKLTGENRSTRRKTCPSATWSITNPTRASAVRGRWLTAWAVAWPNIWRYYAHWSLQNIRHATCANNRLRICPKTGSWEGSSIPLGSMEGEVSYKKFAWLGLALRSSTNRNIYAEEIKRWRNWWICFVSHLSFRFTYGVWRMYEAQRKSPVFIQ
jgi:hypothetical protein